MVLISVPATYLLGRQSRPADPAMSRVTVSGVASPSAAVPCCASVDLDVADGEMTAVLGASGCGKTTLLRIIAGFLEPDGGQRRVRRGPGRATGRLRCRRSERRVGYVPQEGALFPHLDVRRNIAVRAAARGADRPSRLGEMLDLAELPASVATSLPARALRRPAAAGRPGARPGAPASVVLLDEPFSSLDASLRVSTGRAVVARAARRRHDGRARHPRPG